MKLDHVARVIRPQSIVKQPKKFAAASALRRVPFPPFERGEPGEHLPARLLRIQIHAHILPDLYTAINHFLHRAILLERAFVITVAAVVVIPAPIRIGCKVRLLRHRHPAALAKYFFIHVDHPFQLRWIQDNKNKLTSACHIWPGS